jgi:acyl-CoA synthetase (AMP-forming)/AMP-acid ligase II
MPRRCDGRPEASLVERGLAAWHPRGHMTDLILGQDWLRPVHHLPERSSGSGGADYLTIVGHLGRQPRAIPWATFLSEVGQDSRPVTYSEARRLVQQRVAVLSAAGLRRGDRVGVLAQTSIDFALAVLSILEAGGVAVPLNPNDPPSRIARHIDFTEMRFLLYDSACSGIAASCVTTQRAWSFQELASSSQRRGSHAIAAPAPKDAVFIFFSSGTTGMPKAIVQSHYAVAQNAQALADHHRIRPGARLLCVLPMQHVNGLEFTVLAAMLGGGHTVIGRSFDVIRFWSAVQRHGIHIASLVPNLLRLLASRLGLRREPPASLRYAVSAAAPLSVAVSQRTWADEEIGALVVHRPGSTLTEDGVIESCNQVLAFAAVPKCIEFVDEIPRTASGKIRRLEISKRFSEHRDRLFIEDRSP